MCQPKINEDDDDVKFGMDNGGGSSRGCFEVKVRMDATKLMNVDNVIF